MIVHCVKLISQQLQDKDIHTGMSSSVLDDSCISGFRGITRVCLGATGLTSRKATACQSKTDSLVSSKKKQGSETPILSNKFEKHTESLKIILTKGKIATFIMAIEVPTPPQRKINTPFAWWCHFPTTTRIPFVFPFTFKLGHPSEFK